MSVSEKLIRVNNAKETIQEALETPNEHIEEYHTLIEKYISNQPLSTSTGTCENALDVPCKEFVVEGNSEQDGTPTPDEPIAIEVVKGKNLCKTSNWGQYTITSTGGQITGTDRFSTDYIEAKPNTTYTLSFSGISSSNFFGIAYYDSSKTYLSRDYKNFGTYISKETPSNTAYIRVFGQPQDSKTFDDSKFEEYQIQLEQNTQATTYLPYNTIEIEQSNEDGTETRTYQIPLGENYLAKVGSVQDKLVISRNGKCKIEHNVGYYQCTGSEAWGKSGNSSDTFFCGVISGVNIPFKAKMSSASYSLVSHFIKGNDQSNAEVFDMYNGTDYYTAFALYLKVSRVSDITAFKSWVTTNKPIVYYQLATPTEIELDNVEIDMFSGSNYFSIDTSMETDFEVTFVEDVDKKVEELENTILELGGEI